MPFIDVEQLSTEWLQMRVGGVNASHMCDVMAKLKPLKGDVPNPKEAAPRLVYRKKKVWESLTGLSAETYVSSYMDRGLEVEPLARAAYEIERGIEVDHGGLFIHDRIARFMASPDGRVGDNGLIEIKYLTGFTTEANHLDLLRGADIPEEYRLQTMAQMACSGRQFVDFISYDPSLPKKHRLFVKRLQRDDGAIAEMEQAVVKFLAEVDELLERLKQDDPSSLEGVLHRSVAQVS